MVKNVAVLLLRRKAVLVRPSNLPQWRNHVRASGCHGCEILMEATHSESFEEVSPCDMCVCTQLCPTLCDPMDCKSTRLRCPWNSPGNNTGVGCQSHLQVYEASLFSTSSPVFIVCGVFDDGHSDQYELIPHLNGRLGLTHVQY